MPQCGIAIVVIITQSGSATEKLKDDLLALTDAKEAGITAYRSAS